MRNTRLFFLFFLTLLLAPIACASNIKPCYEPRPAITRPPICESISPEQCKVRREMIHTRFSSTVSISVLRHYSEGGIRHFSGTGVVIDEYGRVLTAAHVVKDAYQDIVYVQFRKLASDEQRTIRLREIPMYVVNAKPYHDVALLYPLASGPFPPPIPLATRAPQEGDAVMQLGNVSGFTFGTVKNPNTSRNDIAGLASVHILSRHGDSGGPLILLEDGALIGTLILKDPNVPLSYFVPIEISRKLLSF